ncbi:MAG: NUDIX hydrolase [Anaerolineae bacterium]|nr:NUDIX hydrolase [Anaerolineae bacterium]
MNLRVKQLVADIFQQRPWLGRIAHRVWRRFQARFSAGAVGVVFDPDGNILLLKHVYRPHYQWGLPGGYVGRREDPAQTVQRELLEETGLQVTVIRPLWVEQGMYADHLDLAYLCRLDGGDVRLSSEILAYAWVSPHRLPQLLDFHRRVVNLALQDQEVSTWQ